jgi:hypothetical protein
MSVPRTTVRLLSSLRLTVVLLLLLMLLTYLGTLAQVEDGLYQAQKTYFESFLVLHPVRDLRIPLPGGQVVMGALFVNLLVGGFVRMRRTWRLFGIYVVHTGIALLLVSAFVKLYHSDDGFLRVWEGDSANYFESHYEWEVAIAQPLADGRAREILVQERDFAAAAAAAAVRLPLPDVPFDLTLAGFASNSAPKPAGKAPAGAKVVDGFYLERRRDNPEREFNFAGAYALAVERSTGTRHEAILWGGEEAPFTFEVGGEQWSLALRRVRFPLPFTVRLKDFRKEDHPRTNLARAFESDITVLEGGRERDVRIEMNQPLRHAGFVLFQSSYGPQGGPPRPPTAPMYSVFSVVRNPSDYWPLYACIIIAVGLLFHFSSMLFRYVRREVAAA